MTSDTMPTAHETARRGRTRERVMDAALAVFVETGVHAASVEQITERAGFTRGAFYSNFTSKEELFFALMQRENDHRIAALTEQIGESVPRFVRSGAELTVDTLSDVVLDFLEPPAESRTWCIVAAEFELLALRDASIAERYLGFSRAFDARLAEIVAGALAQIDREFALEPMTAIGLITSTYVHATKLSMLAGESDELAVDRLRQSLSAVVVAVSRLR